MHTNLLVGFLWAALPYVQGGPVATSPLAREWDAIIVGGGTAGLVVGDRLSENGLNTLVLELGGASYGITGGRERPDWLDGTQLSRVDVPGLYKSIFAGHSDLLCSSETVEAFQACTIGGNSAINAGLYFQPPASDWDTYFPAGWHSSDMHDATQRLLKQLPPVTHYSTNGQYYLQSGYSAAEQWLVGSAGFSNVSIADKPDNKDKVFGHPVYDYIGGQRGGPVRTYLQNALPRSNFHLERNAKVEHIIQQKGTASGVVATINGQSTTIKLAKNGRVILSAGALLSPKVLMYSGIGPSSVLSRLSAASFTPYKAKSSWVVNEAVGKGLFDNPNTFIEMSAPSVTSFSYSYSDPTSQDKDLFLHSRSGPYTFASETSVFWEYITHNGKKSGMQGTIDSSGYSGFTGKNTITLNVYGTSGLGSSGSVVLSNDGKFTAGPSSDVYYSDPQDAKSIAQFIYSIFQHLPASTRDKPSKTGLTPLNLARDSTVDQIEKYITTASPYARGEVQHWSSSCRLGQCVDTDTQVKGTQNIHVVDASILFPLTVNPQFGVMAAAERGSEKILAKFGRKLQC